MDLLRFITAGSVDDGKSTLIGRLLYDSKGILADQLEAVERSSRLKGREGIDLALLTDGLRAEREQGITIDVAYRYFSTPRRKFIMADAPGHIQYTRNMVTGASLADAIVVLVDARNGIVEQTRRHSIIASLLRIRHVIVAVNKMDLVGYSEDAFDAIVMEYASMATRIGLTDVRFVPICASEGDNVVQVSERMPWYKGPSLLTQLEELDLEGDVDHERSRLPVQCVIRPKSADLHDYRGYAGRITSGVFRKGDVVEIQPAGIQTTIEAVEVAGDEVEEAHAPMSVTLRLGDDIDVGRGDTVTGAAAKPVVSTEFEAQLCWLDERPMQTGNRYLLQHHSRTVRAMVVGILHRIDVNTLEHSDADGRLTLNEVARVRIRTASPLVYDPFERSKANGAAILVDETSHATVAALMLH
jgi:sulfate adenylyltransferase subunit 1